MRPYTSVSKFFGLILSFFFVGSAAAFTCTEPTNVALASNGATATASSSYSGFAASGAINGDRKGLFGWQNGYWSTASSGFPAWLEVQFNGSKTIMEIDVVTIQDNYNAPIEPTESMTFALGGLTAYQVQYWNGSAWVTITNGSVSGNNKVWKKFSFAAITTTKIRVLSSASPDNYSRLTELEAWTGPSPAPRYNLALSSMGAVASASNSYTSGYGPAGTNNGDRKSLNWTNGGGWNDSGPPFPDWLQIDFGSVKMIDEVDVFTLQDNYANSVEPTESMTFTLWGLTAYQVEYWNGTNWVAISGASVTGNNKIWRKLTFSPVSTNKVRVVTSASVDGYSRIAEVEAYGPQASSCQPISRLDPLNATGGGGENPLSQNFNWSLPLVNLPGRAGMDLNLALSYNSLVWTKTGTYISFNDDNGWPSAGFRLGFPVIQPLHFNGETGQYGFLLISPDGSRTELRQVGTSVFFEAADSSHLLLDTTDMTLRTTDGTQLSYQLIGNQFNCTQIKDRNGNFISVEYVAGRLDKVIDTLGRQIKFNYDGTGLLTSITQTWNQGQPNQTDHRWAEFSYTDTTIQTNFPNLTVYGPANNTIKTLSKVTLADDSHFDFSYTSWGQVWKVAYIASDNVNHVLNYHAYNLPGSPLQTSSAQADCPRFSERRDWVKYWNGDVDGTMATNEEAVTSFSGPVNDTWTMPGDSQSVSGKRAQVTLPDGTVNKIYFVDASGTPRWSRGLSALVETSTAAGWQRRVKTTWTQDNTSVDYLLNPRVVETNVYDPSNNRARTEIIYQQFTFANNLSCWLPRDFLEYAANAETVLRTTRTNYNMSASYTDRRILGLPSDKLLYEGTVNGTVMSYAEFFFDETGSIPTNDVPIQHDANYNWNFLMRGNLTRVKRYNTTSWQSTSTTMKYNTAGAVVSSKDASDHQVLISYADSFSDGNTSRGTLAYPTSITDADGYSSTTKFNFDFGGITYTQSPQPNGTSNAGPEQTITFDTIGRLQQVTNPANNAYTRFVYVPSQLKVERYTTIESGLGESVSFQIVDGAGRTIATANDNPANDDPESTDGYSGQKFVYDVMGRVIKTSNPTETTAIGTPFQWSAVGDDASAGWVYTQQTYDWKNRPLITTNQDGTTKSISYSGCGCAGGQVMTLTDEGTIDAGVSKRRQQRVYSDVLGRVIKNEFLNWENSNDVYATTTYTYNVRDQVILERRYSGTDSSDNYQNTFITYDGYGRLSSQHVPEQSSGTATNWTYNADDTVLSVTDARGAATTYTYNGRHLTTGITYSAPEGISIPDPVTYGYDAAGNRSWMDENGQRRVTYHYDMLSRMDWEERQFPGLTGAYRLSYGYNLAGQLKSITDPTNAAINYVYDRAGRVTTVNGTPYGTGGVISGVPYVEISQYASNLKYRAWGALKSLTYGNQMTLTQQFNQRLQLTQFVVGDLTLPPGAPPETETRLMSSDYQYYANGNLRSASDNIGDIFERHIFTRAYAYDQVGGAKEAYSGSEAEDFLNGTSSGTATGPYRQSFQHDAFGNITSNTSRFWSRGATTTNATYNNNRKQGTGISYDAEGHLTQDADVNYEYDAAGRSTSIWSANTGKMITPLYDGDGQVVHRTEFDWSTSIPNFFQLRSSVLGGRVITELDSTGQKKHTYVYCNGQLIARQDHLWIVWQHETPFTGTRGGSTREGYAAIDIQTDPMGVEVGLYDPYWEPENWQPSENSPIGLFPSGIPSGSCILDGIPVFCSDAEHLLQTGAAEFKRPDVVWDGGRWRFVDFNRNSGKYQTFWALEKELVADDGEERTISKWIYFYSVSLDSDMENLFHMLAFKPSRVLTQSTKNTAATVPAESAIEIARRKNCATPNSVVAQYNLEFEAQWNRTSGSGEENGSLVFYEQTANNYMRISLSEGRHFEGVPAMPEIRSETRKAIDYFKREERTLYLLAIFHTHSNFRNGESRSGAPSGDDIQLQSDFGNPLGIIRTGKGYSFFSNGRTFWPDDPRANECIWILNNQRR